MIVLIQYAPGRCVLLVLVIAVREGVELLQLGELLLRRLVGEFQLTQRSIRIYPSGNAGIAFDLKRSECDESFPRILRQRPRETVVLQTERVQPRQRSQVGRHGAANVIPSEVEYLEAPEPSEFGGQRPPEVVVDGYLEDVLFQIAPSYASSPAAVLDGALPRALVLGREEICGIAPRSVSAYLESVLVTVRIARRGRHFPPRGEVQHGQRVSLHDAG